MATTYNTKNGQQTTDSMAQQLLNVGWGGDPTNSAAVAAAYASTTGGAVTPMDSSGSSGGGGGGGGGGGSSGGTSSSVNGLLSGLDQQMSALMGAMSATNQQDFQEKVREFNTGQANWLQQFNAQYGGVLPDGGQTLQAQQQAFQQAATAAGLTGQYNGQPTLQAQQQQFQQGLQAGQLTGQYNGQPTLAGQAQQAELTGFTPNPALQKTGAGMTPMDAFNQVMQAINSGLISAGPGDTRAGLINSYYLQGMPLSEAVQKAGGQVLTQGNPTPAYQQELANIIGQFNGQPTEQARQFNINTQSDLAKLASTLTGPADYYKYLTALNQGRNIIGSLTSGQPMPAFGAPVGSTGGAQSVQNILGNLGIGSTGGSSSGNPQSLGQYAAANGQGMPDLSSLPHPSQINPAEWDSYGATGQAFLKGIYQAAGWNPNDVEAQINATRPAATNAQATALGMSGSGGTGTQYASSGSQSAFQ